MSMDPNGQDLLSQIAASDRVETAPKSEQSVFMMLLVRAMRLMLQFDAVRHKHPRVFGALSIVWGLLMVVLYTGGILAMLVLIYSYMHFPEFVRDYFERNKIAVKELKIDNYDFSKIEVRDLVDPSGTYTIKKVTIYSSFSEFLQRRVKSVVIDGVTMKISETDKGLDMGELPLVLTRLNQAGGADKIHINTLSVMNAQMDFNGQRIKMPITFSLTGAYDRGTKLSLPFSVKQDNIKLVGALSVSGSGKDLSWTLDISSGTLTLPDRYPENITGSLVFKTKQMKLAGINGNVRLSYGKNIKAVQLDLTKEDTVFKGTVNFNVVNQNAGISSEIKTNVDLNFDGLQIPSLARFETDKPIRVTVKSFARENISLSDLSGDMKGKLSCDGFKCSYHLNEKAALTMRQLRFTRDGVTVESTKPVNLTVTPPLRKETAFLAYGDDKLSFNGGLRSVKFDGYVQEREKTVAFTLDNATFVGEQDFRQHLQRLALDIGGISYETPDQKVENAGFNSLNLLAAEPTFRLNAVSVLLKKNPLIKIPFKLSLEQEAGNSRALLSFSEDKVKVSLNGKMRLKTGEFIGEIFVHPFELTDLPQPLSTVSEFFPDTFQNVSGTMAVLGNLNWKNIKQISGPLFVAFRDVGFDAGNLTVKGLHSVLLLQSVVPFITPAPQSVFVAEVSGPFPFQNVLGQVKFESQLLRVTSLNGQVAGIPLRLDPIILPYKTENVTMYLRNSGFDFADIGKNLSNDTITISGNGAMTVPIRFDKGLFGVRNGEFKISNGYIGYTGPNTQVTDKIFKGTSKIYVQSGNGTFGSAGNGDIYSLFLNLDARLPATPDKFRVKETVAIVLSDWLKPVPTEPVPQSITSKQAVIIK